MRLAHCVECENVRMIDTFVHPDERVEEGYVREKCVGKCEDTRKHILHGDVE